MTIEEFKNEICDLSNKTDSLACKAFVHYKYSCDTKESKLALKFSIELEEIAIKLSKLKDQGA